MTLQTAHPQNFLYSSDGAWQAVREEDIKQAALSLKAMAHPIRLKVLCILGDKEKSVQELVDGIGTSQSNISQHLAIMRDKRILATRREANKVFYRVSDARTLRLMQLMHDMFCQP